MKAYELGGLAPTVIQVRVPDARMYTSDPMQGAVVAVSVDWASITKQLAPKANRSKRGLSRCMSGAVTVKVLERFGDSVKVA